MPSILAVIPVRYGSSRFIGKPLVEILGKPLMYYVWKAAMDCSDIDHVVLATDDARITHAAKSFGAEVVMTNQPFICGTDRVAYVASLYPDYDYILNIQGDEPTLTGAILEAYTAFIEAHNTYDVHTIAYPLSDWASIQNQNHVKVVYDNSHRAIYFSRAPIPYIRDTAKEDWPNHNAHFQHVGIYGFRRETLHSLSTLPVSRLESLESLEQLRWIEHGYAIGLHLIKEPLLGVDVPDDIPQVAAMIQQRQ